MTNDEQFKLTTSSSDLFGKEDSDFLEALRHIRTPPPSDNQVLNLNASTHEVAFKTENAPPSLVLRKDSNIKEQASSDLFGTDDPEYLELLANIPEPFDVVHAQPQVTTEEAATIPTQNNIISQLKRPHSPDHELEFSDQNDIYGPSRFHGWGEYMNRKRAKLNIQNNEMLQNGEQKSTIFKGLALHVNGRTNPSVQVLRKLIIQHGGIFHPYLDRKKMVTHIIASNLTPAKVLEFKNMKVVRPEWLLESINASALLPWQNFAFGTSSSQAGSSQNTARTTQSITPKGPDVALNTSAADHTEPPIIHEVDEMKQGKDSPVPSSPAHDRPLYGTDPAKIEEASRIPSYAMHTSNVVASRKMDDPKWRAEHTAIAPGFIEGYYRNSRLHHLSTWKAELQELVAKAVEAVENGKDEEVQSITNIPGGTSMSGVTFRKPPSARKGKNVATEQPTIMHCDFDSFFVAAGLIDRPHLRGKPVVVCHSQSGQGGVASTSEIASSSYEARKFGIKGGMSLGQARRLCPDVQTIPYEFELYKRLSLQFYIILMSYADDIEAVSVDEALIDVSGTVEQARRAAMTDVNRPQLDLAKELAETIRKRVKETTGCEISIGISHNILLSRVATRLAKPAGSYHMLPENSLQILASLDVEDIRGFGWSTRNKLKTKFNATTLGELSKQSKGALCSVLGKKNGERLWNAIRGVDDTKLESDRVRRSVSCEINYGIRFTNQEEAEAFIQNVAKEVSDRLRKINKCGRSITLKIMVRDPEAPVEAPKFLGHGVCETVNRSSVLEGPGGKATADENIIGEHAVRLLKAMHLDPKELRGVGIHVHKLEDELDGASRQTLLPFKRAETLATPPPPVVDVDAVDFDDKSVHPEVVGQIIAPSFSQLDITVMAALPDNIRREIEEEYAQQNSIAGPSRHQDATHSPTKATKTPRMDVSHITKQLAPKSRPSISPAKHMHPLFARRASTAATAPKVSTQELKLFEVDPDVWKQLPTEIQREQLASFRAANVGTGIALRVSMSAEAKQARLLNRWRYQSKPLMTVRGRRQEVFAKHVEVPALKKRGKTKSDELKFVEGDDIQAVLTQWVENFDGDGPRQGDVDYFGKFLAKCIESDVSCERAVLALKWWRFLLQNRWSDGDDDVSIIGQLWWRAFWDVKGRMDVIVKKRFGGQLSLK